MKETIEGRIQIDFDSDLAILKPIGRTLILEALDEYGAHIDDLHRWTFDIEGSVNHPQRAADRGLRATLPRPGGRAEALIRAPSRRASSRPPRSRPTSPPPTQPPTGDPSPEMIVKATRAYYNSVVDIAHTLKAQKASSQSSLRLWYDRAARQIEELPLLNVDVDALDWGGKVARTIREMAMGINYTKNDATHRIAGTANGGYGGYGYGYGGSRAVTAGVIKKQNNAVLDTALNGTWEGLETSIADMRRTLVAKYKVEF